MTVLKKYEDKLKEIKLLSSINGILSWDQQTNMPPNGAALRSEQIALLSNLSHQKVISQELGDIIEECKESGDLSQAQKRSLSEIERTRKKRICLPQDLVSEMSKTSSAAINAWAQAKHDDDFDVFAPHLKRLLELSREKAKAYNISDVLYDNLLDDYDPATTSSQLSRLFSRLQDHLTSLILEYSNHPSPPNLGHFTHSELNTINNKIIETFGFTNTDGRLDQAAHPFTIGISPNDVRLTTHNHEKNLLGTIGGTIHECGHGLYEQNLPSHLDTLGLCSAPGAAIHESQSRFYENVVGRSLEYFRWLAPIVNTARTNGRKLSAEELYLAANPVLPSPIRVEADETTYNLHIIIRFQLEQALLSGDLAVKDAPEAWNDAYERALGIRPNSPKEGILQDIHWSLGYFGYFPSYTLGNLYSASYKNCLNKVQPSMWTQIEQGDFVDILSWLRENIHQKGALFTQEEIVFQAVGEEDHVSNLLTHFRERQEQAKFLRETLK